jgi:UDP-glucose 4-epimerase
MIRVLVTGGFGFIGTHLVHSLVDKDYDVCIFDSLLSGNKGSVAGLGCSAMQHTVCNYDAVRRAMEGVTIVYHLAARMDWNQSPQHPAKLFSTNTHGTVEVLTAAREAGVQKVVFSSSAAVYGNVVPGSVGGPCLPISCYGASKLAAEAACEAFNNLGLEVVVLRIFNTYGDGGHGVVNAFQNGSGVIHGNGQQTRDFVHIKDVVRALLGAYYWDAGTYNIGTGVETSVLDVWKMLYPASEPEYASARPYDIIRSCADLTTVQDVWKAKTTLEQVLK